MPELPDIENYVEALNRDVAGQRLENIRLRSVFLVRSVEPPIRSLVGAKLTRVSRLGKRLIYNFGTSGGPMFMILHLMVAGRLHWKERDAGLPGKRGLCAFDFENGTLLLTEAGKKKRASLYVVDTEADVRLHDPGGLEVFDIDAEAFSDRVVSKNHTLKRALTDPRLFSGIGGAYADEILHTARLSPVKWTNRLTEEERQRLYESCRSVLQQWTERIRRETADGWPKVTAFRDGMAVHGQFGKPCPDCGSPVQRIVYADNETNYCATCQTGGKVLADRSLSRLLKDDWPRSIEDLEERGLADRGTAAR